MSEGREKAFCTGEQRGFALWAGTAWEGRNGAEGSRDGPVVTRWYWDSSDQVVVSLVLSCLGQEQDIPWHLAANLVPSQVLVDECICVKVWLGCCKD